MMQMNYFKTLPFVALTVLACMLAGCGKDSKAAPGASAAKDDGTADVERGMAALEKQDLKAASAAFNAAVKTCPANFEAQMQLAVLNMRLGETAAAAAAAARAVEIRPDSAEARLVSGQAAYLTKDYARALQHFSAVALEKSLPANVRSEAWAGRGVVEFVMDKPDAARISFLRARRLKRNNASAFYHLGMLYRDKYHYDDAVVMEQFLMASRMLDAKDPRASKILRDIIPPLKSSIAAAAAKRGEAKRNPAKSAKLLSEGKALEAKKQTTAAMKKYEDAFAADPLSGPAAYAFAMLKGANVRLGNQNDVDKVRDAYHAAIADNPSSQAYYESAAQFLYKHKRWANAIKVLEKAIAHDPDNLKALDLLIAALKKAGRGAESERWDEYRKTLQ
jgi:tetratricopeptide (TPR) repeat protein